MTSAHSLYEDDNSFFNMEGIVALTTYTKKGLS